MTTTKDRIKQIIRDCCAGGYSMATDILHEEFVIIHRDELPTVHKSETNGWVTALAQERFQPQLRLSPEDGDVLGEWSRNIAYANLAVAEAVEATGRVEQRELEEEAFALYWASCTATDTRPAPDWQSAIKGKGVERDFLAIARTARDLHRGNK